MSTAHPSLAAKQAPPAVGFRASWVNFWFSPADPVSLHVLRFLAGLVFLLWLLPLAPDRAALFGLGGWLDAQGYREASRLQELPPHLFSWSLTYLCGSDPVRLGVAYWASIGILVLFTLGVATRLTALLTWVVVVSFTANPVIAYDADPLLRMLACYLMVGYLLLGWRLPGQSWAARLLGPRDTWLFHRAGPGASSEPRETIASNLAVRLFQVHFAVAMVAGGLYKLQGKEWWAGLAPWFYLHQPFATTPEQIQAYAPSGEAYLIIYSVITYAVLAWQICFPFFAWRPRWRPLLLGGGVAGFLACTLAIQLPLVGPLVLIGCLAYLRPAEWRTLASLLARIPGVRAVRNRLARTPESLAPRAATPLTGTKSPVLVGGRRS
jgi:hypothetical protein